MWHKDLIGVNLHIARINSGSGTPSGVVTSTIVGEGYYDSTNKILYISAVAGTNNNWIEIARESDQSLKTISDVLFNSLATTAGISIGGDLDANACLANYVVFVDALGKFSSEANLAISRGGSGAGNKMDGFDNLSPLSAKGDVIVHNGLDSVRLAVAADGRVLSVDLTEPTGLKWIDPSTAAGAAPVGAIVGIHFDAPVPDAAYWGLCDGLAFPGGSFMIGNKPNLTDNRFLMGSNVAGSGGSNTKVLVAANLASHRHSQPSHTHTVGNQTANHTHTIAHTHNFDRTYTSTNGGNITWQKGASGAPNYKQYTSGSSASSSGSNSASHKHSVTGGATNTGYYGSGTAFDILPLYFKVRFFIKLK